MTTPTLADVQHDTFTVTLELAVPPELVYEAFADPAVRRRWFRLPGRDATYEHDFRVGGGESARSTFRAVDGTAERLAYDSRFVDLVPARRIVLAYETRVDDVLRWTALVTVALDPTDDGTRLRWTEQVAFVTPTGDGTHDLPHVRGGIRLQLNGLAGALGL
ncbi:SRPBCC domain-containing protein [Mumia sp. zg.B17]|uniref:SRPBCC domain-containing protein n=1 Tax=Mumia sp. zg.B17 TaxID=2855446 RepID=UPI001C6EF3CD|nr:SRPBCC domain-containing protein [Mumia sp. zg.B17]MBW9207567.1 SRPBCC domain-containing protein [Mumia sp. zg.B17]